MKYLPREKRNGHGHMGEGAILDQMAKEALFNGVTSERPGWS
jgi:hypothetical protein